MGSRCFIAHIDRKGNGRAIYCHKGADPSENGKILLQHYNDEDSARTITALRSISSLSENAEETAALNGNSNYPQITFEGGTDAFFGRFWTIGTEWLYAWTPDGWFAAPGFRKAPPELLQDHHADPDTDRRWAALNRQAAAFQTPLPLATVIGQHRPKGRGEQQP